MTRKRFLIICAFFLMVIGFVAWNDSMSYAFSSKLLGPSKKLVADVIHKEQRATTPKPVQTSGSVQTAQITPDQKDEPDESVNDINSNKDKQNNAHDKIENSQPEQSKKTDNKDKQKDWKTNTVVSQTSDKKSPGTAGIVITFDDNNVDEWYSFLVLSNKYGAKATFYVSHFDTLSLDQIVKLQVLQEAKNEIGYHTLHHLNALKYLQEKPMDDYIQKEILQGLALMRENGLQVSSFAYPYGAGNAQLDKELFKHFNNVRYTAYPAKGKKIKDLDSVFLKNKKQKVISAVGIDNGYEHDLAEIFAGIDRAFNNNEILVLYAHVLSNKPGKLNVSMEKLEAIICYAQEKGMKFYTVAELAK